MGAVTRRKGQGDVLAELERVAPSVARAIRARLPFDVAALEHAAQLWHVSRQIERLEREVRERQAKLCRMGASPAAFAWQRVGGRHGTR